VARCTAHLMENCPRCREVTPLSSRRAAHPAGLAHRAQSWGLAAATGVALPRMMRELLSRELEAQRFYREAEALGFSRREALCVLTGVMHMARQTARPVDAIEEARRLLAVGEVDLPHDTQRAEYEHMRKTAVELLKMHPATRPAKVARALREALD
jgi:hypothetical protein